MGELLEFRPFKIGKYLLLERIATGGMAEVYRAKASGAGGFEKQLAIKRILPNYASNEEFRKMFEYEARLSSQLTQANIVQIYDFVKSDETYLLAMEYVNGKNLRQFLNKARKMGLPVPIEFAVFVINEVCKGLEYAHTKKDEGTHKALNIIHRDMSPQNVMISYEGAVKIVDFGIAKAKDRADETRSGVIKGKFGYMSPEQANGNSVDNRTDIFSTGIILFELLTGRRLFAAETDLATLRQIQECVIPSPSRINPRVSSDLERIVYTALSKDIHQRYHSAGDFHRSLLEYMNRHCPTYTHREVAQLLERVFVEEIEIEKRRNEQLQRQSIPFSQGATPLESGLPKKRQNDFDEIENMLEGTQTASESEDEERLTLTGAEADSLEELNEKIKQSAKAEKTHISAINDSEPEEKDPSTEAAPHVVDKQEDEKRFGNTHLMDSTDTEGKTIGPDAPAELPIPPTPFNPTPYTPPSKKGPSVFGTPSIPPSQKPIVSPIASPIVSSSESNPMDTDKVTLSHPVIMSPSHEAFRKKARENTKNYKPKRRMLPLLTLGITALATYFTYRFLLDGGLSTWLESQESRGPTQVSNQPPPELRQDSAGKAQGKCTLRVETDPPGADVYLGNDGLGQSPTTVSSACSQPFELSLRLPGYEPVTERFVLQQPTNDLYRSLKRIPIGTLELVVDRNADVYINGNMIGVATAHQKFERALRANQTYEMRLVNNAFHTETRRKIQVSEGKVSHYEIRMEDSEITRKNTK